MIEKLASFSLVLAPLVCFTSAYQYVTTEECEFTFNNGELPIFVVPEAGPNSPGDAHLNVGNNMITRGWDKADGGSVGGLVCVGEECVFLWVDFGCFLKSCTEYAHLRSHQGGSQRVFHVN